MAKLGRCKKIGRFSKDARDGDFDIVLTNPPFAGKVTGKTQLTAYDLYELAVMGELKEDEDENEEEEENDKKKKPRRKVAGMKRDILFLERCLDFLNPDGRMAIVLPQGNLNNLGTRSLRTWISNRARLLAVVGLHVNTFKPFTGTKTSVLFLQKWSSNTARRPSDYPVFMAVSSKSGKNNSGEYLPKIQDGHFVDEDGVPITQSGKSAAIDHDLDEIAEAFIAWGKTQGFRFLEE